MQNINLRELYPDVYKTDLFVEVTGEVLETIRASERADAAYDRRMYRYKAQYSLDCENGIGGKAAARTALFRCDGPARKAGKADLCPLLHGNGDK